MDRIPIQVFQFLRISKEYANKVGVIGCGIQLDDEGEYHLRETTITLNRNLDEVKMYLNLREVGTSLLPGTGNLRISILQMEEYLSIYDSILEFLILYRRNRFIRLGNRARHDPWELDSHDSFLIRMSDDVFKHHFISDPRSRMTTAGIINPTAFLHEPMLIREAPLGLSVPGEGGWIKLNSPA